MDLEKKNAILTEHIRSAVNDFLLANQGNKSLVTIMRIDIAPGAREARVFFSTLPDEYLAELQRFLEKHVREISAILKKNYRVDRIPKLIFLPENNPLSKGD